MNATVALRGFAILFLLLAGYQAYASFESFQAGALAPASYALRIAAPLFTSIVMQILLRNLGKISRGHG